MIPATLQQLMEAGASEDELQYIRRHGNVDICTETGVIYVHTPVDHFRALTLRHAVLGIRNILNFSSSRVDQEAVDKHIARIDKRERCIECVQLLHPILKRLHKYHR